MQIRTWLAYAVLTVAACGSRQPGAQPAPSEPQPAQTAQGTGTGAMCPMMMDPATTQITTSDTSDGVALVFTTSRDVDGLRTRVRQIAAMHNEKAGAHGKMMGEGGMQPGGMQGGAMMVPSQASVEDVPGGARLLLVPADPDQLAALRQHARMHADMMAKGRCPMMAAPARAPGHEQHHPGET